MIGCSPKVFLAPMAGVTNRVFRLIAKESGADFTITEMVNVKGVLAGNLRSNRILDLAGEPPPVGVQIFGSSPLLMAKSTEIIWERYRPTFIDINMGCPTPKVVKKGMGAALMRQPALAGEITKEVVGAVPCPVTVKLRKGWSATELTAPDVALRCQEAGAVIVTVHGRTRDQFYSGNADWGFIAAMKRLLSVPVVGNGDIFSPQAALDMLAETGCDGVMVGRGALGNPWIFQGIKAAMVDEPYKLPSMVERIAVIIKHLDALIELRGKEKYAVREMRKHLGWYLKGIPGIKTMRPRLMQLEKRDDVVVVLCSYLEQEYSGPW